MHDAPLAVLALVAVCELIGAALIATLVAMTDRKDRPPRAIRASAAVLTALLPWRPRVSCERLNAPGPRGSGAFKRIQHRPSGLLPGHRLSVRAERVAFVQPLLGCTDDVTAASGGGELDHASSPLAGPGVNLSARAGRRSHAGLAGR